MEAAEKSTKLPLDVHLMIENPDNYIKDYAEAGADLISVHAETSFHLNRTIQLIKSFDKKAGVALNPSTPPESIRWVLEYIDFVLLMPVNPGFGGQSFISNSLDKIKKLKQMITDKKLSTLIQVDGGVNKSTIKDIKKAGADVFVAGSAVFNENGYKDNIACLKE